MKENLVPNKKVLIKIGLIYLFIMSFINFCGVLLCNSELLQAIINIKEDENLIAYTEFQNKYTSIQNIVLYLSFIIPISIGIVYIFFAKPSKIKKRIVNIPYVYSFLGASGWIIQIIKSTILYCFFKISTHLPVQGIYLTSVMMILLVCLFVFTFCFLSLNGIHRKFILPSYFSEEPISSINGTHKLSIPILFIIFFISVSIFPCFYLFSVLYFSSLNNGFEIYSQVYTFLGIIGIFEIVTLASFTEYFSKPLNKFKKAAQEIKNYNYNKKVEVVSADDLGELADNFNEMASSLNQKTKKISAIQNSIITGMATMVESRDNSTGGHIKRTSDCVRVFAEYLQTLPAYANVSKQFFENVIKAAPMHDLGKIAVDDAVLRKPGKFTEEEYEVMKSHSKEGARIVAEVLSASEDEDFKKIAINVAHYHHEKWNGAGYPEKIAAEQIPFEARIMALADVFDALVSKRCYKDSFSYDKAFEIIQNDLGTHFDPQLGAEFIKCRASLEKLYNGYSW